MTAAFRDGYTIEWKNLSFETAPDRAVQGACETGSKWLWREHITHRPPTHEHASSGHQRGADQASSGRQRVLMALEGG
jgi:hypothetical protein